MGHGGVGDFGSGFDRLAEGEEGSVSVSVLTVRAEINVSGCFSGGSVGIPFHLTTYHR